MFKSLGELCIDIIRSAALLSGVLEGKGLFQPLLLEVDLMMEGCKKVRRIPMELLGNYDGTSYSDGNDQNLVRRLKKLIGTCRGAEAIRPTIERMVQGMKQEIPFPGLRERFSSINVLISSFSSTHPSLTYSPFLRISAALFNFIGGKPMFSYYTRPPVLPGCCGVLQKHEQKEAF